MNSPNNKYFNHFNFLNEQTRNILVMFLACLHGKSKWLQDYVRTRGKTDLHIPKISSMESLWPNNHPNSPLLLYRKAFGLLWLIHFILLDFYQTP